MEKKMEEGSEDKFTKKDKENKMWVVFGFVNLFVFLLSIKVSISQCKVEL
jgi:hypothetical protein